MKRADRTRRETSWGAFWHDWRRLNTYMMVVAIVALSFKVHRVYFLRDPDPWLLRSRHFSGWIVPPRPHFPARPVPHIRRPGPRKSYTAFLKSLSMLSQRPGIC
jgi:hypothetical protein